MAKKKVGDLVDKGNGRYLLKNVRLSFPYLFEPDEQEDDNGNKKKSYRVTLLLPKATHKPVAQKLARLIADMCEEEYGNAKLPSDKKFLRDGDESDVEDHHGHWTVTVRETRKPILVDRDRQPTEEDDEWVCDTPGCDEPTEEDEPLCGLCLDNCLDIAGRCVDPDCTASNPIPHAVGGTTKCVSYDPDDERSPRSQIESRRAAAATGRDAEGRAVSWRGEPLVRPCSKCARDEAETGSTQCFTCNNPNS